MRGGAWGSAARGLALFPGKVALHLVTDNYGTHKHPHVQAWLKHHPRFVPHFVPTSSSGLNWVEPKAFLRQMETNLVAKHEQ